MMNINDNIRRRREARIHSIMRDRVSSKSDKLTNVNRQTDRPNEQLLNDPEYIWQLKQQQWQEESDDSLAGQRTESFFFRLFRYQLGICLLVFCLVWGMFQLEHDWAKRSQMIIERALTESYDFEVIARWYDNVFQGTPSFIPTFNKGRSDEHSENIE